MDSTYDDELVACLESYESSVEGAGKTSTRCRGTSAPSQGFTALFQRPTAPSYAALGKKLPAQGSATKATVSEGPSIPPLRPSTPPEPTTTIPKEEGKNLSTQASGNTSAPSEGLAASLEGLATSEKPTAPPHAAKGIFNKQDCYFGHRLFLWMPRHLFLYQFVCPHSGCQGHLSNCGVHQRARMVLDIQDYYIVVGEDYECMQCKRRTISWSKSILDQLDFAERSKFPCILTARYACDLKVVRMMRQRTLGNSSSLVCKQIAENHGEVYLDKCRQYATHYKAFKDSASRGLVTVPAFVEPPAIMDIPRHRWFMKVYQIDFLSRLDYELAELISITGEILKIDSIKKKDYK